MGDSHQVLARPPTTALPPSTHVPDRIRSTAVTPVAVEPSHVLDVAGLPHHHRDPFDRLLVAQAMALDVPLMTADPVLDAYPPNLIRLRG